MPPCAALAGGTAPATLDEFIQTRRKEKRIRHLMQEELSRTFVTPLEREDIDVAIRKLAKRTPREASRSFGLDEGRGRVALAGALIALEAQRVLGVPLQVARGGIREGAALEITAGVAAA